MSACCDVPQLFGLTQCVQYEGSNFFQSRVRVDQCVSAVRAVEVPVFATVAAAIR
jgi:hypothetical protein